MKTIVRIQRYRLRHQRTGAGGPVLRRSTVPTDPQLRRAWGLGLSLVAAITKLHGFFDWPFIPGPGGRPRSSGSRQTRSAMTFGRPGLAASRQRLLQRSAGADVASEAQDRASLATPKTWGVSKTAGSVERHAPGFGVIRNRSVPPGDRRIN